MFAGKWKAAFPFGKGRLGGVAIASSAIGAIAIGRTGFGIGVYPQSYAVHKSALVLGKCAGYGG